MVALPAPPEKGPFAPAPLDRVQALVNTRVLHHDPTVAHDRLDGPDALVTWWHDMGRPVDGVAVTEDDVEAARTAREGLRALLALHNDSAHPDDKRAIERLDALAAGLPLRISFGTTDRVDVLPLAPGGTRGALLELLASIPDCRADGTSVPAEGVPGGRLPRGLLRRLAEPLPGLVLDGPLRWTGQATSFRRTPPSAALTVAGARSAVQALGGHVHPRDASVVVVVEAVDADRAPPRVPRPAPCRRGRSRTTRRRTRRSPPGWSRSCPAPR